MISLVPLPLAQIAPAVDLPRWVGVFYTVAVILIAVALVVVALALLLAAWHSRKLYQRIHRLAERVQQEVSPILKHVQEVADNANYISTSVRADVQQLKGTLQGAQERLTRAAAQTEERMQRFNALLEVVQEEAEDLFVDTASTLRGVQAGATELQRLRSRPAWEARAGEAEVRAEPRPHI